MTLAQAIKTYGSVIGAVGIAVLTFAVTNPGCTYDEIAEGLGMGRSTVIRYVHQLEGLSLVARHTQKNTQGLDLATSIKSGVSLVDTSVPLRDTVEPRAPIETGIPQRDTNKNGYPAGIHRESTPLHPHKDVIKNLNTSLNDNHTCVVSGNGSDGAQTKFAAPNAKKSVLDYLKELAATPAYSHIDPVVEESKVKIWHARPPNRKRRITQKFLLGWVNRIERPMEVSSNGINGAGHEDAAKGDYGKAGNGAASRRERNMRELRRQSEEVRFDHAPSILDGDAHTATGHKARNY